MYKGTLRIEKVYRASVELDKTYFHLLLGIVKTIKHTPFGLIEVKPKGKRKIREIQPHNLRSFKVTHHNNKSVFNPTTIDLSKKNWEQFIDMIDFEGKFRSCYSSTNQMFIDFELVNGEAYIPKQK